MCSFSTAYVKMTLRVCCKTTVTKHENACSYNSFALNSQHEPWALKNFTAKQ